MHPFDPARSIALVKTLCGPMARGAERDSIRRHIAALRHGIAVRDVMGIQRIHIVGPSAQSATMPVAAQNRFAEV